MGILSKLAEVGTVVAQMAKKVLGNIVESLM
jgi:hypothetical protein